MSAKERVKTKARRERRRAIKEQEQDVRAQLETVEEEPLSKDFESTESVTDPEALEKEYWPDYGYVALPGPTSFEELDAMEAAREQAHEVQEVTWNVQDLVRNILFDPMTEDPGEKASKITKVANDYKKRVSAIVAQPVKKDIEVLQIEAMLAIEKRNTPLPQRAVELIKAALSPAARGKLSEGDFALPEKKKYPIHDKAHVRNALARAAQQIDSGGEGAEDARKALPKIRAAAKKFGIDVSLQKNAFMIEKDAKGDWRWIGNPSNNFIDWQEDIIEKSAHQNYVAFLDDNPSLAPVFMTWHTPGTARTYPADFWMEQDGALIMSGKLTEDEASALFRVQKEVDLGMSHQAFALRLSDDPRVVTHYWMYEVSDLPRDSAANPFTSLETITKEVGMDKLQYLTEMMGSEEKAKAYLEKTSQMQKQLTEAGITSKEKEAEAVSGQQSAPPAPVAVPLDMKAIMDQVSKELDIEGLNAFVAQAQENIEKVGILEGLVKQLQGSDEEKLAAALTPPAARFAWTREHRASQSDATKLKKEKADEDETLSKAAPGVPPGYWLSELTGTMPIDAPAHK
jgi:hypothetical protein